MLRIVIIPAFILVNIGVTVAKPALQVHTSDALNELDEFIENYTRERNIPGTLVALASKGELFHYKAYGLTIIVLVNRYRVKTDPVLKKILHTFISELNTLNK